MADRALNESTTITADLPGLTEEAVMVSLTNPYGLPGPSGPAVALGEGRYAFALPSLSLAPAGIWRDTWTSAFTEQHGSFTVDVQPLAGTTLWDLRIRVARRIEAVTTGRVYDSTVTSLTDLSLVGGSEEYVYHWLMLPPGTPDSGRRYRVTEYNGSALVVPNPFIVQPPAGTPFALFQTDPDEIDNAIMGAISEISPLARLQVRVPINVLDQYALIPDSISQIAAVWDATTDTVLAQSAWSPVPGRRIYLTSSAIDTVALYGIRDAAYPRWDDSIIEVSAAAVLARAASSLHGTRAGSQAIDMEEHMRRQIASENEYERVLRRTSGRVLQGAREVLR